MVCQPATRSNVYAPLVSLFVSRVEQVALGLMESACPRQGSRVMMFVGGPPTVGPGMIVGRPKTETIRSHTDLQKNNAPHYKVRACVP